MMTRGRPLSRFLLGKAAQIAAILFALVLLTFLMVKMIPGDAASRIAGPDADAAYLSQLRSELGLDQPFAVQLWNYVAGVARGDFGVSLATRQPVIELIRDRLRDARRPPALARPWLHDRDRYAGRDPGTAGRHLPRLCLRRLARLASDLGCRRPRLGHPARTRDRPAAGAESRPRRAGRGKADAAGRFYPHG